MRTRTVITVLTALVMLLGASPAMAVPGGDVSVEPVIEMRTLEGTPANNVLGTSTLVRGNDRLWAKVTVDGLRPGGVYTFWWVIIPAGGSFPDDAFVAGEGGRIISPGGQATAVLKAKAGDPSISGFHVPFNPLDFDLGTAEIHVEVAYHGQVEDAESNLSTWRTDFWTGTACPSSFGLNPDYVGFGDDVNAGGQPHCPVYIAAIHKP
ncbi:MAG: hypothetical protein ACRDWA_02780 [Acidimicrobiia bacterium]